MALKDLELIQYSSTGAVTFSLLQNPGTVHGGYNLVQKIIKHLLTLKGTNSFLTKYGSGFYNLIGTIDTTKIEQVEEIIPVYLKNIVSAIQEEQSNYMINNELEDGEILKDLILINARFDIQLLSWYITVKIVTEAGASFVINI